MISNERVKCCKERQVGLAESILRGILSCLHLIRVYDVGRISQRNQEDQTGEKGV